MKKNQNNSPKQLDLFDAVQKKEDEEMSNKQTNTVNLLDVATAELFGESTLELIRLGNDETAIIPFTTDSVAVNIHYSSESEIRGYVLCNGPDCVLCKIGRKQEERLLLPVYLPTAGCVGILPVSRSLRPSSLLPQIANTLKTDKAIVMFVVRDGAKYIVSTTELQKDVDAGESAIKRFRDDCEAGLHDLSTIYPKIANEELAGITEINRMMELKGIQWNGADK